MSDDPHSVARMAITLLLLVPCACSAAYLLFFGVREFWRRRKFHRSTPPRPHES